MDRNTVRKFVCKRCGKNATDLQGGFTQYSQKHETDLIYENVDLCKKCFKKTQQESKNLAILQEAIVQGIFKETDLDHIKRFQTDIYFRRAVTEQIGAINCKNPISLEKWGLKNVR